MERLGSYGLILEPLKPEDFVFGSSQSLDTKFGAETPLVPTGNWYPYLFAGIYSHQAPGYETNSCVTPHTIINTKTIINSKVIIP